MFGLLTSTVKQLIHAKLLIAIIVSCMCFFDIFGHSYQNHTHIYFSAMRYFYGMILDNVYNPLPRFNKSSTMNFSKTLQLSSKVIQFQNIFFC